MEPLCSLRPHPHPIDNEGCIICQDEKNDNMIKCGVNGLEALKKAAEKRDKLCDIDNRAAIDRLSAISFEDSDWLIIYGFTSHSRIFHLYGDVTIAGEGLQHLGLCSALRAFEQGGIFIVPHLLWHGASVFPVSSEGPPLSVASYDTQGDVEDLF